jgi:pSer/pThr/pTyr-binding forkhead associated (FHA) protein
MPITQQQPTVEAPPMVEQVPTPVQQLPAPDLQRRLPRLVLSDGHSLVLPHVGEVLVGRADPVSGITPDLDLTPHGGEAAGVSRRHAVLQPANDGWQVVDLDSTNATRVNGQRVVPHTPTPVQPGDTLRFGRIEMTFQV